MENSNDTGLMESAGNVSMHGFGRLSVTKSRKMKIFWLVFMLSFLSLLTFHMVPVVKRFLSNPSITKHETIIAKKMQFPSITICGPSISKYKLQGFAARTNTSIDVEDTDIGLGFPLYDRGNRILNQLKTVENFLNVSPDEDEFLLKNLSSSCLVAGVFECNYTTDMRKIPMVMNGFCYKFNPDGLFHQLRGGPFEALSIILFLNVSDKLPWFQHDTGEAVEVVIDDHREYPFTVSDALFAPVGFITQIELSKTEEQRLKAPYESNCTSGENYSLVYPGRYTMTNCQESCLTYKILERCEYIDFYTKMFLPVGMHKPLAETSEQRQCSDNVFTELSDNGFQSCHCALPCSATSFEKSISLSKWPSTTDMHIYKTLFSQALGLNKSEMTDDYLRNNFLRIDIYYKDKTYQLIKEEPANTFDKLVSEIGGQMGIWIGASMFSIMEIICLCVQFLHHIFTSKEKKTECVTLENIRVEK